MKPIYLDSVAAITDSGFQSAKVNHNWTPDQKGPADIKREQVLPIAYPTFGKLTLADRLAFATSCLLCNQYPFHNPEATAITLAIPYGSLSTDIRYQQTIDTIASPALFSATLPSSPISEVAIFHKIKGPNRVFVQARTPGLHAIQSAFRFLELGKANNAIVLYVGGLEPADRELPFVEAVSECGPTAFGLYLTTSPQPQGLNLKSTFEMGLSIGKPGKGPETRLFEAILRSVQQHRDTTLDFELGPAIGTIDLCHAGMRCQGS